jgi:hypothetical protein
MHVAPLHDGNERRGLPRRQRVIANRLLRARLLLGIDDGKTRVVHRLPLPALCENFFDVIGHAVELLCAHHEIDMSHSLHQLCPAALRHAAQETENHLRPLFAQPRHHAHFPDRLLLRHVAHGAGVEQDDVRVRLVRRHLIAARGEHLRHLFGVALVHLATVGFDEHLGHGRRTLPRPVRNLNHAFLGE